MNICFEDLLVDFGNSKKAYTTREQQTKIFPMSHYMCLIEQHVLVLLDQHVATNGLYNKRTSSLRPRLDISCSAESDCGTPGPRGGNLKDPPIQNITTNTY
jgi:hypothetical protein